MGNHASKCFRRLHTADLSAQIHRSPRGRPHITTDITRRPRTTDGGTCRCRLYNILPYVIRRSSRPRHLPTQAGSQLAGKEKDKDGFRVLWCRLKPADKPEAGIPFDTDDAMFSPPVVSLPRPLSQYSLETPIFAQSFSQEDLSSTPPPPERPPVRTYSRNSIFVGFIQPSATESALPATTRHPTRGGYTAFVPGVQDCPR